MPERRRLLTQAQAKRDEAQTIRDMTRFLSVHADKAMFERHAHQLERDAARLEEKARSKADAASWGATGPTACDPVP
jgi:hypothetical protein